MGNNVVEDDAITCFAFEKTMKIMNGDQLIEEIVRREKESGLYDLKIDNISIYNYVSRGIQMKVMDYYGSGLNYNNPPVSDKERKKALRKSFMQFVGLFIRHKKYDNVIRSFERVDFINGNYVDKFTDPLVDFSDIGKSCLILEQGRSGAHRTPRCHSEIVIYTDIIYWLAWKFISLRRKQFYKKHSDVIDLLFSRIESAFPEITLNRTALLTVIVRFGFITKCYRGLFRRIRAKRLFAPARPSFKHLVPAAKYQGLIVYELQHGLVYTKSLTYEEFHDPMFTPDYFLSFGNIPCADSYGISSDKLIEIGWAFEQYVQSEKFPTKSNQVLVVSAPNITDRLVSITCKLAEHNPNVEFYFRPHPLEVLSKEVLSDFGRFNNIILDDNLENITVVLMRFECVMGVNSTVLYEALAMRKKVAKLYMGGFDVQFLSEEDQQCFYLITDHNTFKEFVEAPIGAKPSFNMYSRFKPEIVNALLK